MGRAQHEHLGCHNTRCVRYARGWYTYPVRTVRGALGASRPAPPVRTQRGRLVRVVRTYPTEAPGRTRQLRRAPSGSGRRAERGGAAPAAGARAQHCARRPPPCSEARPAAQADGASPGWGQRLRWRRWAPRTVRACEVRTAGTSQTASSATRTARTAPCRAGMGGTPPTAALATRTPRIAAPVQALAASPTCRTR